MESRDERLKRFQEGEPAEAIETLLNSIDFYFNNEIKLTPTSYQTSLMFIGIHAVALTISESLFNAPQLKGYHLYLENFIDGDRDDLKFSLIARSLNDWRNVLAHQWIGSIGHEIAYDYDSEFGWFKSNNKIVINPRIYYEQYIAAFESGGRIWKYSTMLNEAELIEAKERIIKKFLKR